MTDPIDREFEQEQQVYQTNLAHISQLDPAIRDAAVAAEKLRHAFAVTGIWTRYGAPASAPARAAV